MRERDATVYLIIEKPSLIRWYLNRHLEEDKPDRWLTRVGVGDLFQGKGSLCKGPEAVCTLCIRETAWQPVRLEQWWGQEWWAILWRACGPLESCRSEVESHSRVLAGGMALSHPCNRVPGEALWSLHCGGQKQKQFRLNCPSGGWGSSFPLISQIEKSERGIQTSDIRE